MITASELKKKILRLASRTDGKFLLLARSLRMLHDRDRQAFRKIVKQAKLGSRKAYYLVELAKRLEGISFPRKRLEAIGWTKAQIIAKHIKTSNAPSLLTLAEKSSARDLSEGIRMGGHKPPMGTRCVLLYFNPNQYRVFEKVMQKHQATRGSRGWGGKEAILEKIMRTDLRNSQG